MSTDAGDVRKDSRWHVVGASVRGGSHHKNGQPCQDAHSWRVLPNGGVVVAVADGAGSSTLSQIGSARAALSSVEWVYEMIGTNTPSTDDEWRDLLKVAMQTAHESVLTAASMRKVTPRDLATTLIVTIAMPNIVVSAQVGDGASVVMTDAQNLIAVTAPQRGEFANETTFFTSPNYLDIVQIGIWRGAVKGMAALSDGLQLLALRMPEASPHPAFFAPLFRVVADSEDLMETQEQLHNFLRSDRIQHRADDDLTLVLGILHSPEA